MSKNQIRNQIKGIKVNKIKINIINLSKYNKNK